MTDGDLFRRFGIVPNERFSGGLELALRAVVRFLREARGEVGTPFRMPWRARLAALRRGFSSSAAVLYQLDENDPAGFVPDLAFAYRGYGINGFLNPIVGNKRVLAQILGRYAIPHPRLLATVVRGRLIDVAGRLPRATADALATLASESVGLVFRPDWSGAGEGVFFVRRDGAGWSVNGIAAALAEIRTVVEGLDRYVVSALVEQAAYAREIFPATTNTVRVLTLCDDGGPFVAAVVHRFGSSRSVPIDNWHQGRGGLCASIDPRAALLGRGVTLDASLRLEWHASHPETQRAIDGVAVPRLDEALDGVLRAARCFPGAPCIGWDAVITDDGFSILEANSPPGLFVWQVHVALLADLRVARFFAAHGFRVPAARAPLGGDTGTDSQSGDGSGSHDPQTPDRSGR